MAVVLVTINICVMICMVLALGTLAARMIRVEQILGMAKDAERVREAMKKVGEERRRKAGHN